MITNHLKTVYRNIKKNKGLSFLNTMGLSIGILCFMIILYYFISEISYDRFYKDQGDIYRVETKMYSHGELHNHWATSPVRMGESLKQEFPEVINSTKICRTNEATLIKYDERTIRADKIYYVDSCFLKVFSFELSEGDPLTALKNPNSAVITTKYAKKIFGNENPMGKVIELSNRNKNSYTATITGIIEYVPKNTHLDFEVLSSEKNYFDFTGSWVQNWPVHAAFTFIKVNHGTDVKQLEQKFKILVDKYLGDFAEKMGRKYVYYLKPLNRIHLYSNLTYDTKNGSASNVYLLLVSGIFIFIISWINYVNLTIAQSLERAKEIAIRKFAGGYRINIMKQAIIETLLYTLIPVIISFVIYFLLYPFITKIIGSSLEQYFPTIYWISILSIIIVTALIASLYPAYVISSYKPALALKGKMNKSSNGIFFRKSLTVVQFISAGLLIFSIIAINRQIKLIQNTNVGVDISNILIVDYPILENDSISYSRNRLFKDELKKYTGIETISSSASYPGKELMKWIYRLKDQKDIEKTSYPTCEIDYDFFNIYNPKFLAGRNFSLDFGADRNAAIISKSALKLLGLNTPEEAIGKIIEGSGEREIIGVIDDYHHLSLKNGYLPIIFINQPDRFSSFSIKIENGNFKKTLPLVQEKWKEIFPGNPFNYSIQEEYYASQYKSDYIFGKLFLIFTIISIIISCIGLFSLSHYDTSLRIKEVAIRKLLGSPVPKLFIVLSKDIMKMSVFSLTISSLVGYFLITSWLQNFQFQTKLTIDLFIIPFTLLIVINLLIVSYDILKVATVKPARIIKDE